MLPKITPTQTKAWKKLKEHHEKLKSSHMNDLFKADPKRFEKFSFEFEDFLFDFSKNIATEETFRLLTDLADECQLDDAIEAMFSGEHINETEDRAVLHTALRSFSNNEVIVNGENVTPLIQQERERIKQLCEEVHSGKWKGYSGKKIKHIVNIGIGGSDIGPAMVTEALRPYWKSNIKPFFISNVDAANLVEVVKEINFEETLFIIASKTFTTLETMTNTHTIRSLFLEKSQDETAIQKHFIAVTGNNEAANEFGIPNENIYEIWDWVCGRFSLWGSMGISIALTIGYENFKDLLKGAESADQHFKTTEFQNNIPVTMALLSIWYINFFNTQSEAILPYNHYLGSFKSYIQQGAMESNGKSVDRNGEPVHYSTSTVIWGEVGTNGQHSFHQLLHQGTQFIPCDFIITVKSQNEFKNHQEKLICNALAQTEALMKGRTREELEKNTKKQINDSTTLHMAPSAGSLRQAQRNAVTEALKQTSKLNESTNSQINELTNSQINNYKIFKGKRPSNSILIKELTPYNLGILIAFYEHKIFVQGVIWNIFSFDQWGVELGKELSSSKLNAFQNGNISEEFDSSTNGLLGKIKEWF